MYFFARAASHYGDDISDAARDMVLNRIAEDVLAMLMDFELLQGVGLRDAVLDSGSLEEFRYLTGIRASI
jgi:hypothetical protein